MKKLTLFQVDAFTDRLFAGNPAAVCPLENWLPDAVMQQIAAENNLAETAFFVPQGKGYHLRWFTPAIEVDLCGHATLATAHVLFQHLGFEGAGIVFYTRSGPLTIMQSGSGYQMDFPADTLKPAPDKLDFISDALEAPVQEVWRGRDDYLAIVSDEATVAGLTPDFRKVAKLPSRGLIVSAMGNSVDFVSRCFFPQSGIDEDPVTGSAHTTMAPYWAAQKGKTQLSARQISRRGGELVCTLLNDRVLLEGQAVTYLQGEIWVPEKL